MLGEHRIEKARPATGRLRRLPTYPGYDRGVDGALMESWDHRSAYKF